MSQKVGKRFSNVRFWRYVFTPMLFLILFFGLLMLYSGDNVGRATFPALTGVLRKNSNMNPTNLVPR